MADKVQDKIIAVKTRKGNQIYIHPKQNSTIYFNFILWTIGHCIRYIMAQDCINLKA